MRPRLQQPTYPHRAPPKVTGVQLQLRAFLFGRAEEPGPSDVNIVTFGLPPAGPSRERARPPARVSVPILPTSAVQRQTRGTMNFVNFPYPPPIATTFAHSSSRTGATDSRDWRI